MEGTGCAERVEEGDGVMGAEREEERNWAERK